MIRRTFAACAALLALQFGIEVQAQSTSRDIHTSPVFFWSDLGGNNTGKSSPEEVIATINAREAKDFDSCVQKPQYSCVKNIWGGTHPNASFPNKVNDQYLMLSVDGISYSETHYSDGRTVSSTTNLSSGTAVVANTVCPTDDGFSSTTISIDAHSSRMTCVKSIAPPMQCNAGDMGKSAGSGCACGVGNPIQVNGVKTESQLDYVSADGLLSLRREFLGQFQGWRMPGDFKVLDLHTQDQAPAYITQAFKFTTWDVATGAYVTRWVPATFPFIRTNINGEFQVINPDGSHTMYAPSTSGGFPVDVSGDRVEKLSSPTPEDAMWRLTRINDGVEDYGTDGRLRKMQLRNGTFVVYQYTNDGRLTQMQDSFGRKIGFTHNADGTMASAALPDGGVISYSYQNGILTGVTYPDGGSRQFLYNEAAYVVGTPATYSLTGALDEKGVRIGTYRYDNSKRAISTESAGGANKYTLQYGSTYTQTTTPLGATHLTYFKDAAGRRAINSQNQPAGAGCSAASSSYNYDANGNVANRGDFNGVLTTYSYDLTRNLETSRVEASGTPQARTITTTWHPSYRLPLSITEPGKVTSFTYDVSGNLLQRTVSAGGKSRAWNYAYNSVGQVLTATGPLNDVTSYSYDAQGNLVTVTNALGQTTTLSNYDANGRVGRITDANGLATDLTYSPRGWLISRSVGGETSSYDYDRVGQLVQVTFPDESTINYTYDDAHRLIAVADSVGNRIAYMLDAMGNRVQEQVKDPNGALARQTGRLYDALNRLKQLTESGGPAVPTPVEPAGSNLVSTVTSLTATPDAPTLSDSISLQATVMGSTPNGTVTFNDQGNVLGTANLVNGAASIVVPPLAVGPHLITASYNGDPQNKPSISLAEKLAVFSPTTSVLAVTPDAPTSSQSMTFTATVTGSSPTGMVTFKDGGTLLGTASVTNGVASFMTMISAGPHVLVATYAGDTQNLSSVSVGVAVNVSVSPTQVAWVYPPPPSTVSAGSPIYLRVQVNPIPPIPQGISRTPLGGTYDPIGNDGSFGIMTVKDGSNVLTSATVLCNQYIGIPNHSTGLNDVWTGCWATFPWTVTLSTDVGVHTLTAEYSGNANYLPSALSAQVTVTDMITSTTLISCPATTVVGTWIDCAVTVRVPVGQVALYPETAQITDGTTVLESSELTRGPGSTLEIVEWVANFRLIGLTPGVHNLQAQYPGTPATRPSASAVVQHTVTGPVESRTLLACPALSTIGTWVDCTVRATVVAPIPAPYYLPSLVGQSIQLLDGVTVVGNGVLVADPYNTGYWMAAVRLTGLTAGAHNLQGTFSGTISAQPSASAILTHTVQ